MTSINSAEIKCVRCAHVFSVITHDSVNVSMAPHLKDEFLKGKLNQAVCPECNTKYNIGSAVLYHDMDGGIMISALLSEEYLNNKVGAIKDFSGMMRKTVSSLAGVMRKNFERYSFDVVFSIDELKESLEKIEQGIYTEKIKEITKNVLELEPKTGLMERLFGKLLSKNLKENKFDNNEDLPASERNITINGEKISLKYFPTVSGMYDVAPREVESTIHKIMNEHNIDAKNALIAIEKLYKKIEEKINEKIGE